MFNKVMTLKWNTSMLDSRIEVVHVMHTNIWDDSSQAMTTEDSSHSTADRNKPQLAMSSPKIVAKMPSIKEVLAIWG